jgi:cellulase
MNDADFLKYMGMLPESGKTEDVEFFKIDEASYDSKTDTFGSDWLVKNDNFHTSTIPSDVKPGTYVVRHELISLHNALNDDWVKKVSGAQFYPQCIKVKVTGDGTATPAGAKFPGTYKWDDKGILFNLYYRPKEYLAPGGPVYKSMVVASPRGPQPVVKETGAMTGELAVEYKQLRAKSDKTWENGVHADVTARKYTGKTT